MTNNAAPPRSANRWYSILGFQFSRQQAKHGAMLLAVGGLAFCVAFAAYYNPPRAISRLIRSVGGSVSYRSEQIANVWFVQFVHRQARLFGLTATDDAIEFVQLPQSNVTDTWLHHLKPLDTLTHLQIHERQLGPGLADLAGLPDLSYIAIWHLCSGDLGHLQQLPNLTGVSLVQADCADIDLSKLTLLPKLSWLEFPSTQLSARHFEQLTQIKTLISLNITHAKLDDAAREGLARLAQLPALQILHVGEVTDEMAAMLAKIGSLNYLLIDRPNLTDEGAAALTKLTKLQDLHLQQSARPLDIEALRQKMPRCRISYSVRQSPLR